MSAHQKKASIPRLLLLSLVWIVVISVIGFASYWYSVTSSNKELVYGEWIEVNAPSYDTDIFLLSTKGVLKDGRVISTKFDFDGRVISYRFGNISYEYQLTNQDKTIIKRLHPKPTGTIFVKKGNEHLFEEEDTYMKPRRSLR